MNYYSHTCKCGCGGQIEIKRHHNWCGIPNYIQGHHSKDNNPNYRHGGKGTRLYNIWREIKRRVYNSNVKQFKDYGGRGITICPEWTNDYVVFRDWALGNGYQEGLFFDRENPDGNYEPSNCRFLTIEESNRNKTNTITMEIANEIRYLYKTGKYTQQELAEKFKLSQSHISDIINNKKWGI